MRPAVLFFSVLMQLCLGATYSWSMFVQPVRTATGLLQGSVQLPFTLFYFVFPATLFYSGRLVERFGSRKCALAGGILFGCGWITAGLGHLHFGFMAAGIGILAGVGAGLAYIVPITVCMHWFPRHKGLVTGIAVAGFGGGAALVTQISGYLIYTQDVTVFGTLMICGSGFLMLTTLSALFMVGPKRTGNEPDTPVAFKKTALQRPFQLLYAAMFAGLAAGFAVNANLREIQPLPDLETGMLAVSLFAVANAAGRIGWGYVFDRFTPAVIIQLNLVFQACVLLLLPWLLTYRPVMLLFATLTGFNYGGVLVVYAATVGRIWGAAQVSRVYGWLFSANIPAALSPILAGIVFDQFDTFTPALIVLGVLLLAATAAIGRNKTLVTPVLPQNVIRTEKDTISS